MKWVMIAVLWLERVIIAVVVLVVVASLFLPSLGGPFPYEIAATKSRQKVLDTALKFYWNEYALLPTGSTSNILAVLTAQNTDDQNRRREIFMILTPTQKRLFRKDIIGDINAQWEYLDGWGYPMQITFTTNGWKIRSSGLDGVLGSGSTDDLETAYDTKTK